METRTAKRSMLHENRLTNIIRELIVYSNAIVHLYQRISRDLTWIHDYLEERVSIKRVFVPSQYGVVGIDMEVYDSTPVAVYTEEFDVPYYVIYVDNYPISMVDPLTVFAFSELGEPPLSLDEAARVATVVGDTRRKDSAITIRAVLNIPLRYIKPFLPPNVPPKIYGDPVRYNIMIYILPNGRIKLKGVVTENVIERIHRYFAGTRRGNISATRYMLMYTGGYKDLDNYIMSRVAEIITENKTVIIRGLMKLVDKLL